MDNLLILGGVQLTGILNIISLKNSFLIFLSKMDLRGVEPKAIKVGDVVVYESSRHVNPIIHRVVSITQKDNIYSFATKGDNNPTADRDIVTEAQIKRTGKAVLRLPYLGWIKIGFVEFLGGVFS